MGSAIKTTAQPALRRVMRAREYFTLAFGSIVGVGWLVVINDWLTRGGPGGAMLAYFLGGLALVPVALVYGRLTQRLPGAGSEIAYTEAVFPRPVSFATGWIVALAYLVVCPFEAVAIGQLLAFAYPQLNSFELYRMAMSPSTSRSCLWDSGLPSSSRSSTVGVCSIALRSRTGRRMDCWWCSPSLPC
jgi:amino acid permease